METLRILAIAGLMLVVTASNILCVMVGAKVAQALCKGEEVKVPNINPLDAYKEQKARNRAEREQNRQDTIMQNIDNYNGTAEGQKDVPEG